jgi:hypothetical protein
MLSVQDPELVQALLPAGDVTESPQSSPESYDEAKYLKVATLLIRVTPS